MFCFPAEAGYKIYLIACLNWTALPSLGILVLIAVSRARPLYGVVAGPQHEAAARPLLHNPPVWIGVAQGAACDATRGAARRASSAGSVTCSMYVLCVMCLCVCVVNVVFDAVRSQE